MKKQIYKIFFLIIFLSLFCIAEKSEAANIYVDQTLGANCTSGNYSTANRTCTGSDGNAYTTIQAAINSMSSGDDIYMRGGTYHETHISLTNSNATRHGSTENKNKLTSYPGEWAIIDGQYQNPEYFRPSVIWGTGGAGISNWIFERFEITGGGDPVTLPGYGAGIRLGDFAHNVEFRYLYIHDNYMKAQGGGHAGGIIMARSQNCIVEYCYFKGNGNPWYLERNIVSIQRSNNIVTVTTDVRHEFQIGWFPDIEGVDDESFNYHVPDTDVNPDGILSVPNETTFTYVQAGPDAISSGGIAKNTYYDRGTSNAQIAVTSDYAYAKPLNIDAAMFGNVYRYNLFDGTTNVGQGSVVAFAHKGMQRLTGYELAETEAGGLVQNQRGAWAAGTSYAVNDVAYVGSVEFGPYYICIGSHTSDTTNQPASGASWQSYWTYNDNLPNDDSMREYGDKIHHNIIKNLATGFRIDQDYCQVHNNIIWLKENNNDTLLIFESKDGFNGGRRGSTRTCFYNNTAYADGGMGIGFSVASRSSDETYDCATDGNVTPWGYGYAQNNIIMDATFGYDSSPLFAEMAGNANCTPPNPLNPEDGHFLFHRNLFFNNTVPSGRKLIRLSNMEYTPAEIDATPASDITWQINEGTLFAGSSGADQYKTIGSFHLDESHTISNGGIGGNHPYLEGVTLPTYVGATNPEDNDWVDGVLSLATVSNLQNAPSEDPSWIEGTVSGDEIAPNAPSGLNVS